MGRLFCCCDLKRFSLLVGFIGIGYFTFLIVCTLFGMFLLEAVKSFGPYALSLVSLFLHLVLYISNLVTSVLLVCGINKKQKWYVVSFIINFGIYTIIVFFLYVFILRTEYEATKYVLVCLVWILGMVHLFLFVLAIVAAGMVLKALLDGDFNEEEQKKP